MRHHVKLGVVDGEIGGVDLNCAADDGEIGGIDVISGREDEEATQRRFIISEDVNRFAFGIDLGGESLVEIAW